MELINIKKIVNKMVVKAFYPVISLPLKKKKINITDLLVRDSLQKLHNFSPDPGSSCVDNKIIGSDYDLDIIVPVYNVKKYVRQCIESILNQKTQYNYRLILIDDGSTDGSSSIIDKYAEDKHVVIVHQDNKGFSGARNTGIRMLSSKYVMFVDSDDYLTEDAVELLLKSAFKHDADIVQGGYENCTQNGKVFRFNATKSRELTINDMFGFAWGKVIKSKIFTNIIFPENYWYEDSVMHQVIYPMCNNMYGIRQSVYVYRSNSSGISQAGVKKAKCIDSFYISLRLFKDRNILGLKPDQDYYEYMLRMAKLTADRTGLMQHEIKKAIFYAYAGFIKKNFSDYISKQNQDMEYALRHGCFELYKLISYK